MYIYACLGLYRSEWHASVLCGLLIFWYACNVLIIINSMLLMNYGFDG